MAQGGEVSEGFAGVRVLLLCDEGDADFVGGVWGDVGLAELAPIDLEEVCPRGDGVVLAKSDTAGSSCGLGEAGPGGDAGVVAVGADDVAAAKGLAIGADFGLGLGLRGRAVDADALDGVFPVEADAEAGGAIEQELVKQGAADAASGGSGECGFGGGDVARRICCWWGPR